MMFHCMTLLCSVQLFYGLLVNAVMSRDTLYVNIGETVELRCPYPSHDFQLQWRGPPHLTILSLGKEIKTYLRNYERLEIYGNHDKGEFNLKIANFTRSDEGEYRCFLIANGNAVESSLQVYIRNKPVLFQNKTLVQLKTEILKPVWVSLTVKSFEKPVVFWRKSCGGELSTWFVREIHNNRKRLSNTYLLNSTIIPLEHKDFGSYSVRIRNSEGSTDVTLYLMYEALYIDIFPKTVTYSTYAPIQIGCTLNPKQHRNWTFSWKHYWDGVFIRTLEYTITDNVAVIYLPSCDYADNGEYTCTLHVDGGDFAATSFVHIKGPPIITHRNMSLINGKVVLSIYVFSDAPITNIIWIREISGKTTDNGSPKKAMKSIRNATVTILSYEVRVSVQGHRIEFNIVELNVTKGRYVCQIRNDHALKEVSFNIAEIASLLDSYNRTAKRNITEIHSVKTTTYGLSTSEQLYIFGSIGGFAVITVGLLIAICCGWRHRRQHTRYITAIHTVRPLPVIPAQPIIVELNVIENIGDTIYEEINSNEHLPETEETDFRSETSFSYAIESDLKDESKYEDIDGIRIDKHGYLECATNSISVVQSGNSLPSSDGYIVPTPEYLDLEEKSSDIPTETLYQNE